MMQEMRAPNRRSSEPFAKDSDERRFGARISCIMAPSLANPRGKIAKIVPFDNAQGSARQPDRDFHVLPGAALEARSNCLRLVCNEYTLKNQ